MKKKTIKLAAIVTAVMILTAFTDVPKDHWAYDIVDQAQKAGLVKGVSEALYEPQREVTKQEMAIILYRVRRLFDSSIEAENYIESQDVAVKSGKVDDWAQKEVSYGLEKGFWSFNDFSGGSAPGSASRQMIARWLFDSTPHLKTFGLMIFNYLDNADIDPAYYPYVDAMYKYGIMIGGDGMFNPQNGISRAEAATVAIRMRNIISGELNLIGKQPFVYESGVLSEFNAKSRSFKLGEKLICISSDSKILLDGKIVDISGLAELAGKQLAVSMYINGENVRSIIMQTRPISVNGKVERIVKHSINGTAHEVVTINVGGTSFDYVRDNNTDTLRTLTVGNNVAFIADGIYLLEIK